MDTKRRVAVAGAFAATLLLLVAAPATAGIKGNCSGSATIDGIKYDASYDTADNPIVVPADREGLRIPYEGSVDMENTNHLGAVGIVIGPVTVNVADWGLEENPDDVRATTPGAIYVLGNELNNIVGIYQLTAFHDADGGNCDADARVKLEGDPLSTPIGAGATAGLVVTAAGTAAAGIKRKSS